MFGDRAAESHDEGKLTKGEMRLQQQTFKSPIA
jgi:hypothetical protein